MNELPSWAKKLTKLELARRWMEACEQGDKLYKENAQLRAKLAAWDRWEHAWVFGGDVAYPGKAGVTDPRETLDALERLALGVPEEEADDE